MAYMRITEFRCFEHGHTFQKCVRDSDLRNPAFHLPCKECGSPASQTALSRTAGRKMRGTGSSSRNAAVLYRYRDSNGEVKYRNPARWVDSDGTVRTAPIRANEERVELASIADMERHYRETGERNNILDYDGLVPNKATDTALGGLGSDADEGFSADDFTDGGVAADPSELSSEIDSGG